MNETVELMNDGRDLVFVVGCQRSGTTWLQLLLYQHPDIASSHETHLFDRYVAKLEEAWAREKSPGYKSLGGLARTLESSEFDRLLRAAADVALGEILAMKKGARLVVEKTPDHVSHTDTILRLYPAASFIHIVRDPRSVACSLRDGSYSWATTWASADPVISARHWNQTVARGRSIKRKTERYLEVRYEDLLQAGEQKLEETFSWLGIEVEPQFCAEALASCALSKLQTNDADDVTPWKLQESAEAFYRKGQADSWREELTARDRAKVEYIAGDLMNDLGYDRVSRHPKTPPLSLVPRLMRERAVEAALSLVAGPASISFARRVLRKLESGDSRSL